MPVPQENQLFVQQASCLFKKGLLTMVQHLSIEETMRVIRHLLKSRCLFSHLALLLLNRQDACSTRKSTLCATGILPVQKRIIDNGARSQY
jgi:hypothetical protein